jgi:hypothetical protein
VSGQSDEYRERLDVVAFRIWRRVLPLLNWIARDRLGRSFAAIGFLLAFHRDQGMENQSANACLIIAILDF